MKSSLAIALLFILVTNLTAQKNPGTFVFEFTDAAMAPQYHRSYTIKVSAKQVTLNITNYADVLVDATYKINEKKFNNFQKKLLACSIHSKEANNDSGGCTGGTGNGFTLPFLDGKNVTGGVYDCGGKEYGNIEGNISDAINIFTAMVPDFTAKMEATRK